MVQALVVAGGSHDVELEYLPDGLLAGAAVSLVALPIVLALGSRARGSGAGAEAERDGRGRQRTARETKNGAGIPRRFVDPIEDREIEASITPS